jgi:hypothetical protein
VSKYAKLGTKVRYLMALHVDLEMDRTSYFGLSRFEFGKYV